MKIAIFSDTFPPQTNGVSHVVFQSAKNLADLGHKVIVFTVSKNFFAKQINSGVKNLQIISLPSVPALVYAQERFHVPFSATYFRLKKFAPDVIHIHTPFGAGWMGIRSSKKLKIPLIGTHHTFYDYYLKHARAEYDWAKKFSWKYTVAFYNHCDLILSPTQSLAETLIEKGLQKPVDIIQNSIDTVLFRPGSDISQEKLKSQFGIQGKSLVYMGRVSYEKNIGQVVKAFALMLKKTPKLKLMIIGDGPERKKLEKLAQALKIENNIIFTGFLHGEDLVKALQANDIFLTASKSENMPLSVLEAMAAGLPIITIKEKGLAEIVQENINGFFAKTDDPEDIAEKALELLSNEDLLKKFGENSRKLALEYSKEKVATKLEEVYKKVIKQLNKNTMRICLYLEFYHFLGGFLYKNIGTGLLSSYRNQKKSLQSLGINFTEKLDE